MMDAKKAKEISCGKQQEELNKILNQIIKEAQKGRTILHIHYELNSQTIKELKEKEFFVKEYSSIAIQKESLYYSIHW